MKRRKSIAVLALLSLTASCGSLEKVKARLDQEKTICVIYEAEDIELQRREPHTPKVVKGSVPLPAEHERIVGIVVEELQKGFPDKQFKIVKVPVKRQTVDILGQKIEQVTKDYSQVNTPLVVQVSVGGAAAEHVGLDDFSNTVRIYSYELSLNTRLTLQEKEALGSHSSLDSTVIGSTETWSPSEKYTSGDSFDGIFPEPAKGLAALTGGGNGPSPRELFEKMTGKMDSEKVARLGTDLADKTRAGIVEYIQKLKAAGQK